MRQRLLIIITLGLLAACGQKGPLVMPQAEETAAANDAEREKKD